MHFWLSRVAAINVASTTVTARSSRHLAPSNSLTNAFRRQVHTQAALFHGCNSRRASGSPKLIEPGFIQISPRNVAYQDSIDALENGIFRDAFD